MENHVKRICRQAQKRGGMLPGTIPRMAKRHPLRPHLKAWRQHFGYPLEWLAERLGVGVSSVPRWESGENGVQEDTFRAIASAYGITPAELSAAPSEAGRARHLHRLLEAMRDLDDRRLGTLADLAEELSGKGKP